MMAAIEIRGGDFMKGNGAFHAGEGFTLRNEAGQVETIPFCQLAMVDHASEISLSILGAAAPLQRDFAGGTDYLSRDLAIRECCSPRPTKRRSSKSARRGRKSAATRASTKFTIQYFRKAKHPETLTFHLSSFEQARKVPRIAGEFADAAVRSFTVTSEDGRTETWLYREGTWRRKRR